MAVRSRCSRVQVGWIKTGEHPARNAKVVQKRACGRSIVTSPKPTSGESARFHVSDYRLVVRAPSGLPVIRDLGVRG